MSRYQSVKEETVRYTHRLTDKGYLIATSGNVSRVVPGEAAFCITPSSMDYVDLTAEDMCVVDYRLGLIEGPHTPSIEAGLHATVYQHRLDAGAVIHTHQVWASIFALLNEPIPALFDEAAIYLGPSVEVVPYAISGSPDLAQNVATKLDNRANAYILQNHGVLVLGRDLAEAWRNVEVFERMAQAYYFALVSGRTVSPLPEPLLPLLHQVLKGKQDAHGKKRRSELEHERRGV